MCNEKLVSEVSVSFLVLLFYHYYYVILLYMFLTASSLVFPIVERLVHSCILHCVMGYYVSQFLVFKKWVHILAAKNTFSLTGIHVSSVSCRFIVQVLI